MALHIHCNHIWDEEGLTFYAKGIYCLLAKFSDKEKKECWPSLRKLKGMSGLSKPTIIKALTELKVKGFIEITARQREDGTDTSNLYRLPKLIKDSVNDVDTRVKEIDTDGKGDLQGSVNDVDTNNYSINNYFIRTNIIYSILEYWNSKGIVIHRKLTDAMKGNINSKLNDYSPEEIREAIDNYAEIIESDEYYWTHKWPLGTWLTRQSGFVTFLTENKPFDNFRKNKGNSKPKVTTQDNKQQLEAIFDELEGN